jgi:hypothetical protein
MLRYRTVIKTLIAMTGITVKRTAARIIESCLVVAMILVERQRRREKEEKRKGTIRDGN